MAAYSRQSSFADGSTINASLFNNEYDALAAAFVNTSGHKHDGTTGEGPVIALIGDASIATPLNKVLIDSSNDHIEFYSDVSSSSVQQMYMGDGVFAPVTDSDVDLGTSSLYFKNAFIDAITTTGNVGIGGNLTVTGTTTFNGGTINLGDAATDNVAFNGTITTNLIFEGSTADGNETTLAPGNPGSDITLTLPSSASDTLVGKATTDTLTNKTLTSPDINGGTIDGAVIGGTSPAAITGTAITGTSFVIGSANISEAELEILDGATVTTDELNILDGVTATATELNLIDGVTATTAELNILDGVTASAADINLIDGITNGTVIASKAIITDANKDITGGRNITISGELDAGSLDIEGDADINGTLEADAITVDGVALNEFIADTVGAMVSSNTESNITVSYDDADNTLDFVVGNISGTAALATESTITANNSTNETVYPTFVDGATGSQGLESDTGLTYNPSTGLLTSTGFAGALTGNASTATILATARTIHGVSFDGSVNIDLSESIADTVGAMVSSNTETGITVTYDDADNTLDFVIGTLNQDTTGNAATATILETARTIGGTSFDGSANIAVGLAATATTLATARTIHGVSFDGSANIDLSESIADTIGAMVGSNTETGITVTYDDADNTLDFTVGTLNQDTTGSAATLTTPRAIAVAGDVTGTANFDGSAAISITTTLATDAIITANITNANVTLAKMAANSVDSDQYVDGSIDLIHMSANSVDSDQYVDGSIDTAHLADDAVTSAKLDTNLDIAGTLDVTGVLTADSNATIAGTLGVTGVTTFSSISDGTITVTAFVDEDNMASNSATLIPTQQSVKAYVDNSSSTGLSLIDEDNMASNSATRPPSQQSVKAYTDSSISSLVDSSPAALNTLNELAAALGDDASFSTTVNNNIATKLPKSGGAMTGAITTNSTFDGRDVATDGTKLDGIEANATADQTNDEIKAAVEAASDSNTFTDADHTKLNAIEASATADQTNAEIRTAVEAASDSNVFTDADHTKLNGIEASADVTDTTNVVAALTAGTNVAIAANGTISATDTNTNTTYSAGTGMSLSGTTFNCTIDAPSEVGLGNLSSSGNALSGTFTATGNVNGDGIIQKVSGSEIGRLTSSGNTFIIKAGVQNGAMQFQGNDNGSTITALTLDIANAGAATFNNNVTAYSDERLKTNIKTIDNALDKVSQMRGVTFDRDGVANSGVIAQEFEKIAPELVLTANDEMGTKSVAYGNTVGYLIEAIKELKAEVADLKTKKECECE